RLDTLERGPRVRRVAVVPEAPDRLEALVAKGGGGLAEDARRPHHLVDAGRRRERRDVAAELLLQREHEVEADAVAALDVGQQAAHLPEVGLLLACGRAERVRVDLDAQLGEAAGSE